MCGRNSEKDFKYLHSFSVYQINIYQRRKCKNFIDLQTCCLARVKSAVLAELSCWMMFFHFYELYKKLGNNSCFHKYNHVFNNILIPKLTCTLSVSIRNIKQQLYLKELAFMKTGTAFFNNLLTVVSEK